MQLPKHQRCISHTINLIATTGMMKSINKTVAMRTRHTNIINKCLQLWCKAGRPKSAEIIKEVLGHHLSYPGITRWNSYYASVNQIVSERDKLPTLYEKLSIKQFLLKENEVEYLVEYLKVLKPLASALDILQADTNIYYGFVIPTIASLKIKLEKLKVEGLRYLSSTVNDLLISISRRFREYLTFQNEDAILAAVSHPAFKMRWVTLFKGERDLSQVSENIKRLFVRAVEELTLASESEVGEELSKQTSINDFFEFDDYDVHGGDHPITVNSKSGKAELECLQYLQDPLSELAMFNKYKYVQKLFFRYNTALPSSAAVERMFSYATFIDTPRIIRH
ncbi:uncharacterized protein LOC116159179 [Photinus pyralis]|uniref:uncharacterized protein LOC116159179 n=1 Tax=Photinus pyralis TaxID=7054 RepID=UPI001266EF21|nr:uncharacterized protein LOC116159179 [Photinus pyralis]